LGKLSEIDTPAKTALKALNIETGCTDATAIFHFTDSMSQFKIMSTSNNGI
jgi:hypothetical protein